MKTIEKIALALFSTLVLIMSVIFCLLIFGWIEVDIFEKFIVNIINDSTSSNIILGLNIIFILLAIRCIFFGGKNEKQVYENNNGILLQNSDGKLFITKETIENLVNRIVKGFNNAEDVATKVELDKENFVRVYVELNVGEKAVIKELSTNLQTKIKETVKSATDLEVKEVNIKVRNIGAEKEDISEQI